MAKELEMMARRDRPATNTPAVEERDPLRDALDPDRLNLGAAAIDSSRRTWRGDRFWDGYIRSLKPLEVEEPIDVYVHRPPAYVLALLLLPTRVSPNMVTVGSIVLGFAAGLSILTPFRWHLPIAGLCVFGSAVFDCADGQLARMRGSSSAFGRMLDGAADYMVSAAVVGGAAWLVLRKFQEPTWLFALAGLLTLLTILTGTFHTTMYDHFKNVFLRLTHPSYRDGEDLAAAEQRFRAQSVERSLAMRLVWSLYFFYMRTQSKNVDHFDPYSKRLVREFPEFSARHAAIYREHAGSLMRIWRSFFGFGSLVFGLALAIAFDVAQYYLLFRLVVLNAVFYGYLRPRQRIASERARQEMASALE
jgi:phosphatidylglycerophosphate synthase